MMYQNRLRWMLALLLCTFTFTVATCRAAGIRDALHQPDAWYRSPEAVRIAAIILSYQSEQGSWPKNIDTTATPYTGKPEDLHGTFDNGATVGELRFLARVYNATKEPRYQKAFLKGFDHILKAQYPTGGWPQYYPPSKQYHRYITFNDDAMVHLMEFIREIASSRTYDFVDAARRAAAQESFARGIQCILKCQIKVNGRLTAWCAQHDEKDYSPRPARTFELTSLSGSESVGIVRLLMSLDNPDPEIIHSVQSAVAWFQTAKLPGIKEIKQTDKNAVKRYDTVVVQDPTAPPMWARFYEIATNKPIFSSRDGIAKSSLADISYERRNGYAWLGYWPQSLLDKDYPAWKAKWATRINQAEAASK